MTDQCRSGQVVAVGDFNATVDNFGASALGGCTDTASARHAGSVGTWPTTLELTLAMTDYIDNFYNRQRRHSYLGNLSPADYEKLWHDIQPHPQLS